MPDSRFTRLKTDPRFRSLKRHENKVAVDDRFSSVFSQTKKQSKIGRVDKYGRRLSDTQENESLRRFYRINPENQLPFSTGPDYARGQVLLESSDEEEDDKDISSNAQCSEDEHGEGIVTLSLDVDRPIPVPDGEDGEVDLDEDDCASVEAHATLSSKTAHEDGQESSHTTRRIAVVDLDWDHVRAIHLYKVFSSAMSPIKSPPSKSTVVSVPSVRGKVLSVRIYPSNFGLERMAQEEDGPPIDLFKKRQVIDTEEVNERTVYETGDADEYDEDALRRYQLERLRYYYAIVECDSIQLASYLYSELHGAELERSANVLNLSFVPDDMTFEEEWRDQATAADESTNYQPLDFSTDALRHSKVKLTWDQDDPERDRVTRRALSLKEIEDNDFHAYIASSSSSDDGTESMKKSIDHNELRALLLGGGSNDLPEGWAGSKAVELDKNGGDVDMEVTFRPALSGGKDEDETTLGRYQRRMREKRKKRKRDLKEKIKMDKSPVDDFFARSEGEEDSDGVPVSARRATGVEQRSATHKPSTKEELSLLVTPDQPDSERKHFDMTAIIKAEKSEGKRLKGRKKKAGVDNDNELQDDFTIDVTDERFRALHEDYAFAIDPSNPRFKKTKSMSALLQERSKRTNLGGESLTTELVPKSGTAQSLTTLVERVKGKKIVSTGDAKRRKL